MKNLVYITKIFLFIIFFSNNYVKAAVKNEIIVNVGNQIITSYELKNKIRTSLFLGGIELNQENINKNKNLALKSLINYKIKKTEVERYNLDKNKKSLNNHLKRLSSKYKTNVKGLIKIFNDNELDFEMYSNEIETEYLWQNLIFSLFGKKIIIDEKEIIEELKKNLNNNKGYIEYELAEIEIMSVNSLDDQNNIKEITKQISLNGFKNTAIKYSVGLNAFEGGNIGWISEKSLSEKILKLLQKIKTGEITEPIYESNTISFIKLLNKRSVKVDESDLEKIKQKIIVSKKNEQLNLFSNNHLSQIKRRYLIEVK